MGIETALAVGFGLTTLLSAGSQVAGGIEAQREADRQAGVAIAESEERAEAREREVSQTRSKQLVGFLKSGVQLAGTPEEVLAQTEELGAQEVASIRRSGQAQARSLQARGRQQLFTGIGGGLGALSRGIGGFI